MFTQSLRVKIYPKENKIQKCRIIAYVVLTIVYSPEKKCPPKLDMKAFYSREWNIALKTKKKIMIVSHQSDDFDGKKDDL